MEGRCRDGERNTALQRESCEYLTLFAFPFGALGSHCPPRPSDRPQVTDGRRRLHVCTARQSVWAVGSVNVSYLKLNKFSLCL